MQFSPASAPQLLLPEYSFDTEKYYCHTRLSAFIEKTFRTISPGIAFLPNWHIDCIAEYLEACYRREIKRLIINIPPRYLKSISCTVAFPAWLLGLDPKLKIMAASYSKDLAYKHSVDCRYMIESEYYKKIFPATIIEQDSNQKSKYITTMRGQRFATSVGATATGEGGNFLIMDDPHSADQAQSKVVRESQLAWFDQTFTSRLNDKERDVMIVIMQRLHQNDLTGHLLDIGGWNHLNIPAIFDKSHIYDMGRFYKEVKNQELLHEERENAKSLAQTRRTMSEYAFAGQYLQNPSPEGGGIFKTSNFQLYPSKKRLPEFFYIIQSWDTAFTEDTENDLSAFSAWGVFSLGEDKPNAAMLIDCWQERLAYPELRKRAKMEYQTRYGEGDGRRADIVIIENKGSGITLIQDLQRAGIPMHKYNPGRVDKVQRSHSVTYLLENKLIYLPESDKFPGKTYAWAQELVDCLKVFNKGEHDDFVDSTVQAWQLLRDYSFLTIDKIVDEDDDIKIRKNPYAQ